jgi:hypothetical protein
MDNLMKLVTTVLEWTYEAGETNVRAERSVLRRRVTRAAS